MRKRIEPRKIFEGFQQLMIIYWGLFPKESLKSNHKCQKTFKKVMGWGGGGYFKEEEFRNVECY